MRPVFILLTVACILSTSACGGQGDRVADERDEVGASQNVTLNQQPQAPIFLDFEKNWRELVNGSPEFMLPVRRIAPPPPPEPEPGLPEPAIKPECVYSEDAGGFVPQVTIIWNELVGGVPVDRDDDVVIESEIPDATTAPAPRVPTTRQPTPGQQAPPNQGEPVELDARSNKRFDLAVHQHAFDRGFFSTALATNRQERFNLPANNALAADTEAVLLTGPTLFPKLLDYRRLDLRARDDERQFRQHTLVLRDLTEGLTYRLRISSFGGQAWNEERQVVFLTPVCPDSF